MSVSKNGQFIVFHPQTSISWYFHNFSAESAHMNSWSDEEDEREKLRRVSESKRTSPAAAVGRSSRATFSTLVGGSRTLAPANVSKVINKWLFLYPEELRCNDETMSSTYEQYVTNADAQVKAAFESCEGCRIFLILIQYRRAN